LWGWGKQILKVGRPTKLNSLIFSTLRLDGQFQFDIFWVHVCVHGFRQSSADDFASSQTHKLER
jgi:hypothetical protein